MKKRIRIVRASEIKPDLQVNRPLDQAWVDKLVKNWNENALGTPVLSSRGTYFIPLDGQHRIEAIKQMTADDRRIECLVYEGLMLREEAWLFLKLNEDRPVLPFYRFERLVTAEDPDALAITHILKTLDLRLQTGSRASSVSAVVALQRIFRWDPSGDLLRVALTVPMAAWGRDATSFGADIIGGVALFARTFPEVAMNGNARLTKVLSRSASGASGLVGKARTIREVEGGTVAGGVAKVIQHLYNKGLTNKLVRT